MVELKDARKSIWIFFNELKIRCTYKINLKEKKGFGLV